MCNFNGILYRSLLRSLLEAALFWLLQTGCPEGAAYFTTKSAANKAIHQYSFQRRSATYWYQIEQFINIHFSAVVRPVGIK